MKPDDFLHIFDERRHKMLRKLAIAFLTILYLIVLNGCHTIHGAGKDVESAGETIQEATD